MSIIAGIRGGPLLRPRRNAAPEPPWISELTGDVVAIGPGSAPATLTSVMASPGVYSNANISVDAKGRVTAASNGTVATGLPEAPIDGKRYARANAAWSEIILYVGPQGPPGEKGEDGAPGPAGADSTVPGPQGPKGEKGADGTSVQIVGSVPTSADLPPSATSPGDGYLAEDTGHLWVWDGSSWTDVGLIQGPPGETGDTGPTGATGPRGDKGDPGPTGATGGQGPPGMSIQGPAGVGVPAGGTTGQVLTKLSSADYATTWSSPSGGSGPGLDLQPSEGDLVYAPADDVLDCLPRGAAGQVLQVDPAGTLPRWSDTLDGGSY